MKKDGRPRVKKPKYQRATDGGKPPDPKQEMRMVIKNLVSPAGMSRWNAFSTQFIVGTGAPSGSDRLYVNNPANPDPNLTSTPASGIIEQMAIYGAGRVSEVRAVVRFRNLDTTKQGTVYITLQNTDPGTTLNPRISENALSKRSTVGVATGENSAVLSISAFMHNITGDMTAYTDQNYSWLALGDVADKIYIGFGCTTMDGGNWAVGVFVDVEIYMFSHFYFRLQEFGSFDKKLLFIIAMEKERRDRKALTAKINPRIRATGNRGVDPDFFDQQHAAHTLLLLKYV
jgi:hypothetical protein